MAGPDPRARSRSQCPRHTSQIAIHCIPPWGDPSRPSLADVNLARYLILTELAPRLSDSVVLGSGTRDKIERWACLALHVRDTGQLQDPWGVAWLRIGARISGHGNR